MLIVALVFYVVGIGVPDSTGVVSPRICRRQVS